MKIFKKNGWRMLIQIATVWVIYFCIDLCFKVLKNQYYYDFSDGVMSVTALFSCCCFFLSYDIMQEKEDGFGWIMKKILWGIGLAWTIYIGITSVFKIPDEILSVGSNGQAKKFLKIYWVQALYLAPAITALIVNSIYKRSKISGVNHILSVFLTPIVFVPCYFAFVLIFYVTTLIEIPPVIYDILIIATYGFVLLKIITAKDNFRRKRVARTSEVSSQYHGNSSGFDPSAYDNEQEIKRDWRAWREIQSNLQSEIDNNYNYDHTAGVHCGDSWGGVLAKVRVLIDENGMSIRGTLTYKYYVNENLQAEDENYLIMREENDGREAYESYVKEIEEWAKWKASEIWGEDGPSHVDVSIDYDFWRCHG